MVYAVVVGVYGSVAYTTMDSLKDMQDAVGGLIEYVRFPGGACIVNEEGRVLGLPLNEVASIAMGRNLVGPAVFVGEADAAGNDTDVLDRVVQILLRVALHRSEEAATEDMEACRWPDTGRT